MNKISKTLLSAGLLGATLLAQSYITETTAHAQATVGGLRGQIRDAGTKEAAVGATIVATSPALQGEQVVISDENGLYFITALPAGLYTLTVYYQDNTFSRGNVLINIGKEAVVNVTVDTTTAAKKGETIVIKGGAPIIDQGSQKTGVTITDDYTRNIPVGRTFGEVLGAASGSQNDQYGTSISGSTSVENTYIVNGLNTTDTSHGLQSSNLPNEFVSETEVITGGYNAEYGRATGGIINVVTKSGSNEFHGSVFGYLTPGGLVSSARTVERAGGSIAIANNLNYDYDVGAELGGPIIKDKLWFHVGFNPSSNHATTTRTVQQQLDDNQDGIPDIDANSFTKHKFVSSQDFDHHANTYFFTAKLSGEINANNTFSLSAFGNPTNGNQVLTGSVAPQDEFLNEKTGAYDVVAKYTSKLNEGKTQIDAVGGYHHGYDYQSAPNAVGNAPGVEYLYSRSLYEFQDLEGGDAKIGACNDARAGNPYPKIVSCPVEQYLEQGLGFLEHRDNNRLSGSLTLTQRVKLLGYHVFRGGIDIEASSYNTDQNYSGGGFYRRQCNTDPATGACVGEGQGAPGTWTAQGFAVLLRNLTATELLNPAAVTLATGQVLCNNKLSICGLVDKHTATTSDRSIGAFLQDSWSILPNLTLDFGIRFEQQVAFNAKEFQGTTTATGEIVPSSAFTLNNWAPRLGINWDPTGEGKSKIFAHYGRFFENIPMDINVRAYGGQIDSKVSLNRNARLPSDPLYDANCNVDHGTAGLIGTLNQCTDQKTGVNGSTENTAPGLQGQYTDEYIAGAEYELVPDFKLGLTYTHRTLPVIIEDISADDANSYVIANPGQNFDSQAADLDKKAAAELTSNPAQSAIDSQTANSLRFLKKEDPPSRNYDALTLTATQRPTHQSLIIASYTYSQERGNYPGLFSTETGQLDPNITSQYDLPGLVANRYGFLGLDRPHNFKVDGFYMFDLHEAGLVTLGGSFRMQSGIAHNALGINPIYDQTPGEVYVLPRGEFARSPTTERVDIHVSYGRRVHKDQKVEVFVDAFNLLNQQDELTTDETYTFSKVNPVVGGQPSDLTHLKSLTDDGFSHNLTPTVNPNFGKATSYGAPRSFRFGARYTF